MGHNNMGKFREFSKNLEKKFICGEDEYLEKKAYMW